MKRNIISLTAVLSLSGLLFAGGDIAPVEEPPVEVVPVDNSVFYVGAGLGHSSVRNDYTDEEIADLTLLLQAGYQYNRYIAVEGRLHFGVSTDYDYGNLTLRTYDGKSLNWGLYVKPMYPVGDFSVYALLGYGGILQYDLDSGDAYESGFQWGLGAGYAFTDEVSVFVDYTSLYSGTGFDYRATTRDIDADIWTLGVSYKF